MKGKGEYRIAVVGGYLHWAKQEMYVELGVL